MALLPGGVIPYDDMFRLQREVGRPITWTALLTVKGRPYHEQVIEANDAARRDGVEVWPQVSCRPLVFQMNLEEPFTLNIRPSFARLMDHSIEERLAAYRDPAWRAAALEDLAHGTFPFHWEKVSVAESPGHPELADRPILDVAAGVGLQPARRACSTSRSETTSSHASGRCWPMTTTRASPGCCRATTCCWVWPTPAPTSPSCATPASPPTCWATGCSGRQVMPIERAIHKLTAEPAGVYGLTDRGVVAVGMAADLCVFDPDTVAPGPLRRVCDFPANGERLTADEPVGMTHVLVNGTPIRVDGAPDQAGLEDHPGVVLRG